MHYLLARLIALLLLLSFSVSEIYAQKRTKNRAAHTHITKRQVQSTAGALPAADISNPPPGGKVIIPQQSSLTPQLKGQKKVVIAPAPPPPPGPTPLPPYPKR